MILVTFNLQITWYLLPSFKSIQLSVLEKKFKIDFQDGDCGGHIEIWIRTILDIFDLQVSQIDTFY